MFTESEAVVGTMLEFMDQHQIPSLSVHDSLIVRKKDQALAEEVLKRRYEGACGIKPALEVTPGPDHHSEMRSTTTLAA